MPYVMSVTDAMATELTVRMIAHYHLNYTTFVERVLVCV